MVPKPPLAKGAHFSGLPLAKAYRKMARAWKPSDQQDNAIWEVQVEEVNIHASEHIKQPHLESGRWYIWCNTVFLGRFFC